jgi:hypothetical protein
MLERGSSHAIRPSESRVKSKEGKMLNVMPFAVMRAESHYHVIAKQCIFQHSVEQRSESAKGHA